MEARQVQPPMSASTVQEPLAQPTTREPDHFEPIRMMEVEISRPLPSIAKREPRTGKEYRRINVLVRLFTYPIGIVELVLDKDELLPNELAAQIWSSLATAIKDHMHREGLAVPQQLTAAGLPSTQMPKRLVERQRLLADAPFVSIIVATRDRPQGLANCIDVLLELEYPSYEILVVDNAPSSNATEELIRHKYGNEPKVRYVREDQPGLASAHNRGLQEINAPFVAFTDDDVVVDRHWLTEIVAAFQVAPNVGCVTGMILPAEIETPAQAWIEQYSGFGKGFEQQVFDLHAHRPKHPLFPYAAGTMGSGASMAFKTSVLRDIGGFDSALGAGSKGVGGDDLAAFFEIVVHGYTLVYNPAALLYHWHRRDYDGLRRQAYGYGVGLFAFLTKTIVDKPSRILDFIARAPYGLYYILSSKSPKNSRKLASYPRELTWIERKGMLYGPLAYLKSHREVTRLNNRHSSRKALAAAADMERVSV